MRNFILPCFALITTPLMIFVSGTAVQANSLSSAQIEAQSLSTELKAEGDPREGFPGDRIGGGTR